MIDLESYRSPIFYRTKIKKLLDRKIMNIYIYIYISFHKLANYYLVEQMSIKVKIKKRLFAED